MERIPSIKVSFVPFDENKDRAAEYLAGNESVTMYAKYPDHNVVVMPDGRFFGIHIRPKGWKELELIAVEWIDGRLHIRVNQGDIAKLAVHKPFSDHVIIQPERLKERQS